MGFLIQQILVYCLAALLIGGIIGWILKSFFCERDCEAKVAEWEAKYNALNGRYKSLEAGNNAATSATAPDTAASSADLTALRGQISGLEETNRLQANRIADLEGELSGSVQGAVADEDLASRLELMEQDLTAARKENASLASDLKDAKANAAAAAAAGAAAGAAGGVAASANSDSDAKIAKLEKDLNAAQAKQSKAESDLAACKAARADLEAKLKEASQPAPAPVAPAPAPAAAPEPATTAASAPAKKSAKKEKFTTDAPAPKNLLREAKGTKDDLKEIWGVGPVMEGVLNKLGIYHFWQVAELSDRDVEWVSANINTFPDRIKRDRWVEQAGELHKKHHG